MERVHCYAVEVTPAAIDANGHANNIEFVRWMQEAAVSHADGGDPGSGPGPEGSSVVPAADLEGSTQPADDGDRT